MAEYKKKLPVDPTIISRARELRRAATPAERKLWSALRGKQLYGLKFRRQHPLPPYIVDFYCHEKRLVVELDGGNTMKWRERVTILSVLHGYRHKGCA